MKIVKDYPPNFKEIDAAFGIRKTPGVVFTYGDTIYSPHHTMLPNDLVAHEEVHERQQADMGGPELWWERYLVDPQFRLDQEVEAYRTQLGYAKVHYNRARKRDLMRHVVKTLTSSIYGNIITKAEAERLLND